MKKAENLKGLGRYGTIGIEIVLSVMVGLFIGMWLDERLHTGPWLTLVWFGFGCAAAGKAVYRSWKTLQAAAKREEAEEGNPAQEFPDEKSVAWQREEEKKAREAESAESAGADAAAFESPGASEKTVEKAGKSATNDSEKAEKSQ